MKGKRNIEAWEAAIIKQMLAGGKYTRDQIISFFSRPERPINGARITEISKGELFAEVDAATEAQVTAHIAAFATPEGARTAFFEAAPLHPVSVAEILPLDEEHDCLLIEETERVECKESLNFSSKALYARTIAAFANARGGLLVFGVRDEDKKVIGIKAGKLTSYDPAKLNQYLASILSPVPDWQKVEHKIAGKMIGIIYVPRARQRPLMAAKDARLLLHEVSRPVGGGCCKATPRSEGCEGASSSAALRATAGQGVTGRGHEACERGARTKPNPHPRAEAAGERGTVHEGREGR